MSRVVAYIRVSTDKQTVENQLFEINQYLKRHDMAADEVVEETVSGTKQVDDRKLGDLVKRLDKDDTLIVSETSRISRRLSEIFTTIQFLIDRGVNVIAVKQNYQFGNDIQSKVIAFAFGLAAEIERDLISSRTRETLARLKAEGKVLGRPKGFTKPEFFKLNGKDEEIMMYLDKNVSRSAISRIYGVHRETVTRYISANGLEAKLRTRKLDEAIKHSGGLTMSEFHRKLNDFNR